MSDYCMLLSQTFYGLLFSYLTITDVTSYVDHTVHLTKSLLQTVLQMLTKNNSCTLCVPMFGLNLMCPMSGGIGARGGRGGDAFVTVYDTCSFVHVY